MSRFISDTLPEMTIDIGDIACETYSSSIPYMIIHRMKFS